MTFDQFTYLLVGLIFVGTLMVFGKDYLINKKILKYFHDFQCYDENSAKNINTIINQSEDLKLMPYVKLFRRKTLCITSDKRLYLNQTVYKKQLTKDIYQFLSICMILLIVIVLTIWI